MKNGKSFIKIKNKRTENGSPRDACIYLYKYRYSFQVKDYKKKRPFENRSMLRIFRNPAAIISSIGVIRQLNKNVTFHL